MMPALRRCSTAALAAVMLIDTARRARTHQVSPSEERIFRVFNEAPDAAHVPAWAVMQSGSLAAVFVVSAQLAMRGRRQLAAASLITGTMAWGGVKVVKPLIGRGRPAAHLDDVSVRGQAQTGLGYPSGHAAVALTLALIATGDTGPVLRTAALVTAGVTGGTRMYVGAHLPLDVAGGLAIGLFCGRAANAVIKGVSSGAAGS